MAVIWVVGQRVDVVWLWSEINDECGTFVAVITQNIQQSRCDRYLHRLSPIGMKLSGYSDIAVCLRSPCRGYRSDRIKHTVNTCRGRIRIVPRLIFLSLIIIDTHMEYVRQWLAGNLAG